MVLGFFYLIMTAGCSSVSAPPPHPAPPVVEESTTPQPFEHKELVLDNATNHRVVKGETLSIIAAKIYGKRNMYYFPLIMLANPKISNPDEIESGTILVIPNLQLNLNSAGAKALLKAEMLSTSNFYNKKNRPGFAIDIRYMSNRL
jgi:LysM repeat protein